MTEQSDIRLKRQLELPSGDRTIDPLDFMRRTGPYKTLIQPKSDINPEESRQSYLEPYEGRFYYVKDYVPRNEGKNYERWGWGSAIIRAKSNV